MSKKTAVQPTKDEVKAVEVATPAVEKSKPVTAQAASAEPKKQAVEAPIAEKTPKVKKPKLVRDSFTIPETDYALFATLKQRALTAGVEVKKGEILRAAVVALAKLDDAEFIKAIGLVERIKTGRPKK